MSIQNLLQIHVFLSVGVFFFALIFSWFAVPMGSRKLTIGTLIGVICLSITPGVNILYALVVLFMYMYSDAYRNLMNFKLYEGKK